MATRYPTKNDMSAESRTSVIALLNANLASSIDLGLQAKQAHWNVKGPQFLQLHELFDKVASEAQDWSDLLAERAVQLGGSAQGTLEAVRGKTTLTALPDTGAGKDYVDALSTSVATFGKGIREAIKGAEGAGDSGSADLFTEISRGADKTLWFLEAHLHADR